LQGLDAALAPLSASIDPLNEEFLEATRRLVDQRLDDTLARLLASLEGTTGDDDDYVMPYGGIPGISYDDVNDDDLYDRVVNYVD